MTEFCVSMSKWLRHYRASICSSSALTNQSVLVLEDRKLTDIVSEFGLEVPYTASRLQNSFSAHSFEAENDDISIHNSEEITPIAEEYKFGENDTNNLSSSGKNKSTDVNNGAMIKQVRMELQRPLQNIKTLLQAVSFQREDNIKHEVELNLATDIIEDLSIEHYQRLEDAFAYHDDGGKGYLSKSELRDCLRTLGHNLTEQQVWKFMAQVDVDHSGTLDFEEFFDLMSSMMCGWDPKGDLGICWRALDPRGHGSIKVQPLLKLFQRHGAKIQDHEIKEMFENIGETEEIDFDQFYLAVIDNSDH